MYNWTVKEIEKLDKVEKVEMNNVKYIYYVTKDDHKRTGHGKVQYSTNYFKSSK